MREELHLKAADQDDNMSSDDSGSEQEPMEVNTCFSNSMIFLCTTVCYIYIYILFTINFGLIQCTGR